jgi:hypothetical protein
MFRIIIPRFLGWVAAILAPHCCASLLIGFGTISERWEILAEELTAPPLQLMHGYLKITIMLFEKVPFYAIAAYLFWLFSCVWWFMRPKWPAWCAMFAANFMTGPSIFGVFWLIGGAKVGHS